MIARYLLAAWRGNADLYLASQPEVALPTWLVARLRRVPVIYYSWELYGEEGESESLIRKTATRALLKVERFLLRRVDAVIHASPERRKIYVDERGASIDNNFVIENFMVSRPASPGGRLLELLGKVRGQCRIVIYTGAFMPGRCLEELLEAYRILDRDDLYLVFVGGNISPDYWEKTVGHKIEKYGLSTRVRNIGWIPPGELPSYIADADVGVIMYTPEPRGYYHCAASRMGHYINEGVPVVVPPYPYIGRLVRQADIGVCAGSHSPEHIAEAIASVLDRGKAAWSSSFDDARRTLNWESQEKLLLQIVRSMVPR